MVDTVLKISFFILGMSLLAAGVLIYEIYTSDKDYEQDNKNKNEGA